MESSHITLEKYKSKIQYTLNSKGFIAITLESSFLEDLTKKDIDQQSALFKYAKKSIEKEGFKTQPMEIKK